MIAWWWLIVVGLVMFWVGYIVAGMLFRAIQDADEWEQEFRQKYPDWPASLEQDE